MTLPTYDLINVTSYITVYHFTRVLFLALTNVSLSSDKTSDDRVTLYKVL